MPRNVSYPNMFEIVRTTIRNREAKWPATFRDDTGFKEKLAAEAVAAGVIAWRARSNPDPQRWPPLPRSEWHQRHMIDAVCGVLERAERGMEFAAAEAACDGSV